MPKRLDAQLIELSDMSKLRVVAHLESRGNRTLAKGVADDIDGPAAKEVARVLLRSGTTANADLRELVKELRASAHAQAAAG